MGKPRKNLGPATMHTDSHGTDDDDSQADTEDGLSNILNKGSLVNEDKFDKALIEFYMKHKVKSLKRKIMAAKMRDDSTTIYHQPKKARKQNVGTTVLTRYSGKLFSSVVRGLTPKQIDVIKHYGMECLLKFVKTDVPLRFVKWIACSFDTTASEIQLTKQFIPVTKQTIHNILDLPIGGIELVPDCEAGREFMLSHFKLTSIPSVNYFANKLISREELSDEDIFICFMSVAFTSFLCPNSSLLPSTQYFHIFKDSKNVRRYDLSKFVYDWLVSSIKNFKEATRVSSKRSITFGGCHYALAVSYLDAVEFGLNSLPEEYPRLLVWIGNRIRKYSEMDKISSNSYGKIPLKRLVPSSVYEVEKSYGKDSCKKFQKTFSSPFNFNGKLKAMFSYSFTDQVLDDIAQIVHSNAIGKPKDFEIWSESLVCDVLKCMDHTWHDNDHSISQKSMGNLFQFKFPQGITKQSLQHCPIINEIGNPTEDANAGIYELNTPQSNFQGRDITDIDSGTISKGKLASGKYQHLSKLISENEDHALGINQPNATKHDITESTTLKPPNVVDSFQVQSGNSVPPTKKDKEDAADMKEGNGCVVDDHLHVEKVVATVDPQKNEDQSATIKQETKVLSPIVPIRLSQIFSEQGSENNYITIKDSPTTPSVANSKIQAVATHIAKKLIDLSSPICDPQVLIIDDSISPEVKITGECNFKCKYQALSKETDEAYNKLKKYAIPPPNDACVQNSISAEGSKFIVYQQENTTYRSDNSKFKHSSNYQTPSHIEPNFDMPSSSRQCVPRRYVQPCRRYADPYVPVVNNGIHFPVLPSERRHYSAICHLGKDPQMKSVEAVRYEKVYCSFESLATLEPFGHIDNYLILCYCRKLFLERHPSISKKHYFFSYVGETIMRYNGNNGDIVQTAFEGANSAFPLWRSDQLQFPIVIGKHWFLFSVCLKAKVFAFCDSLYDGGDAFHNAIRGPLIENFITLWNILVAPLMSHQIDFYEFQTIYPVVPKQNNSDDCGVFLMKFMDIHDPRAQLQHAFSHTDILNLRIKYANDIFFSNFNTLDKLVVAEFFGDVGM